MTEQDVRLKLLQLIEANGGSYNKASKRIGYSAPHLARMVKGLRQIPEPLLREIGVKLVQRYESIGG